MPVSPVASARGKVRALSRHHGPDHPITQYARRDLVAVKACDYLQEVVDSAPPLTPEQIAELQAILNSAHTEVLDATGLCAAGE